MTTEPVSPRACALQKKPHNEKAMYHSEEQPLLTSTRGSMLRAAKTQHNKLIYSLIKIQKLKLARIITQFD